MKLKLTKLDEIRLEAYENCRFYTKKRQKEGFLMWIIADAGLN